MALDRFGGFFDALSFFYGGPCKELPPPLVVLTAPSTSPVVNPGSITLENGVGVCADGNIFFPLNTNAPVLIGMAGNQEKVTPSAVTNQTSPVPGQAGFTATFVQVHGIGDVVSSGTAGLQEAINEAQRQGGGVVVVSAQWAKCGGTQAMINAAVLPSPVTVTIQDNRT